MTFFDDLKFLTYKGQSFLVDKFSGFSTVDFSYKISNGKIYIKYFMNIYFSGEKLELSKTCTIPTHHNYSTSRWSIFNDETDEFKFIYRYGENGNNLYEQFKRSSFESENKSDLFSDYVKWFAESTNTSEALRSLKTEIEYSFNFIQTHRKK